MDKILDRGRTITVQIKRFFRETPRKFLIGGGIVLAIILIIIFSKNHSQTAVAGYVVKHDTVVEAVELSGTVESVDNSNLGFADGGRVAHIYVHEGDTVNKGATLAQLDVAALVAKLHSAEAGLTISMQNAFSSETNLAKITDEQNSLVASAWQALHSNLAAIPSNTFTSLEPPTITGSYTGTVDGSYTIIIYASNTSTGASFNYTGLESGTEPLTTNTDVALGTHGLFIRFPSTVTGSTYTYSTWTVDVPNVRWSGYTAAKNAYDTALATRDKVIADASSNLTSGTSGLSSVTTAEIAQAQAAVDEINAGIERATIRAPFAGIVGSIDMNEGESVSPNTGVLKLIGADLMQVVLSVPELDIHAFSVDQTVKISFDALAGDFTGTVSRIDPGETVTNGVPVYLVDVLISGDHTGVRSGMTARVTLDTRSAENVVTVPSYLVSIGKGPAQVRIKNGKDTTLVDVTIGLIGTNGLTEITSGLADGQTVVPF